MCAIRHLFGSCSATDGKTPLSESAQQASDGKIHAARLLSHCERARTLSAAGRVDEAIYLARAVCRACTHSAMGQVLLVSILEGSGRLWEAQQEAEEACERNPDDEAIGVTLARERNLYLERFAAYLLLSARGIDLGQACAIEKRAFHDALAGVLARRGKIADAEGKLKVLTRDRPGEDSRASRALRGLRAAMRHKAEGNTAYAADDFVRAAAEYTRGLDVDEEGCLKPTLLANRAQARLQEERLADALADCNEAVKLDAENVKLLLRRASCHLALKDAAKARYDYAAALKLDPTCKVASDFLDRNDAARRANDASESHRRYAGGFSQDRTHGDESDVADEFVSELAARPTRILMCMLQQLIFNCAHIVHGITVSPVDACVHRMHMSSWGCAEMRTLRRLRQHTASLPSNGIRISMQMLTTQRGNKLRSNFARSTWLIRCSAIL